MVYGFGRGFSRGGDAGFGFRGGSPPWPYVGRGRGGLPRCRYPGAVMAPSYAPVSSYPPPTREEEIDQLKRQAKAIKVEFDRLEARIRDLETSK